MTKLGTALITPLHPLLNLFLASPCLMCDRTTPSHLCQGCRQRLQRDQLAQPLQDLHSPLPVLAWGAYQGGLRQALGLLKYQHKPELAQILGDYLGQCWQHQQSALRHRCAPHAALKPIVVPIPLHRDKLNQRGFNQAELLAAGFCRRTQLPLAADGLARIRATQAQHGLGGSARQRNLEGAFALGPAFHRQRPTAPVLLLDDIYTTGATARSAAQTLRRYGISVIGVGAMARAMPSAALEQS